MKFAHLDPATRRRLEERGIDIERSYALFRAELRTKVPPRLLADLGDAPILDEATIDKLDAHHGTKSAGGTGEQAWHGEPTSREIEILQRLADGSPNAEIGADLHVSPETVKTHVRHLLSKLGARNRAHLAALAIRWGFIA